LCSVACGVGPGIRKELASRRAESVSAVLIETSLAERGPPASRGANY